MENQGYQVLRAHPAPRGSAGDPSEALRVVQVREAKKAKQDLEVLRASQETQDPRGGTALPDPEVCQVMTDHREEQGLQEILEDQELPGHRVRMALQDPPENRDPQALQVHKERRENEGMHSPLHQSKPLPDKCVSSSYRLTWLVITPS